MALVLGLVVLLTIGIGVFSGRRTPGRGSVVPAAPSLTTPAPATAADLAAVQALLDQAAAALLARDQQAWNATLDPDPPAAAYRSRQQRLPSALASVPITTWRYQLVGPVTARAATAAAQVRLGRPALIVQVRLDYALAAVDPAPTSKDLWLTVVRRAGRWYLAGDDDLASAGDVSWRGPWDFGPLVARTGPHTLVLAHPDHAADLGPYTALVEAAVPVVDRVWGASWNQQVAVLIPDTTAEFTAVSADSGDTSDIAAVAVADAVQPGGVVLGARIVLNPAALNQLDADGRTLVIQHELTHLASRADTSDHAPVWVVEGLADYVGHLDPPVAHDVSATAVALGREVRAGTVPAALPTDAEYDGNNSRLAAVYDESWLACRLIAGKVGVAGLVRFYRLVNQFSGADPSTAVARSLAMVLGESVADFTMQWRRSLVEQLGHG